MAISSSKTEFVLADSETAAILTEFCSVETHIVAVGTHATLVIHLYLVAKSDYLQ